MRRSCKERRIFLFSNPGTYPLANACGCDKNSGPRLGNYLECNQLLSRDYEFGGRQLHLINSGKDGRRIAARVPVAVEGGYNRRRQVGHLVSAYNRAGGYPKELHVKSIALFHLVYGLNQLSQVLRDKRPSRRTFLKRAA